MRNDMNDDVSLLEGIMTTRAMRRFTDTPVDEADIWTVLAAAQQGPSGGNIQPWQFVVVTDPSVRARLAELYATAYDRYEAAVLAKVPEQPGPAGDSWRRTVAASRHLAEHLAEVPVIIAIAMADISMDVVDDEGTMDVGTPYASVYPAAQNLMLAARALGLGTAMTTVYRIHHDDVRDAMGVPDTHQIVALIPMGHPTGNFGVAPRRPVEKVTHWDQWGNRRAAPSG